MQGFMKRGLSLLMLAMLGSPAMAASCMRYDGQGDFLGWADYPHCLVDQHAQSTVRWLDDWFSQPPSPQPTDAVTELTPEAALAQGNRDEAEQRLRQVLAENPAHARALTLRLQLDATASTGSFPLTDGATSWNSVAQSALTDWNAALTRSQFTATTSSAGATANSSGGVAAT